MTQKTGVLQRAADALEQAAIAARNARGWRRRGLAFVAGAAGALAFAPFYALPLLVVSFCVLVLLLDGVAAGERRLRSAFSTGWWFGFGHFLIGLYWLALSFFVQAETFAWMAPFALFGMPAVIALFPAMAAALAMRFWSGGWRRILVFALAWSVFEYARGHVLTGLPWNLAGQAMAGTAAGAQSAAYYGAYGLSLLVVGLFAAPAAGLGRGLPPARRLRGLAVSAVGVAALFALGSARLAALDPGVHDDIFLRVVQPNIPQREKIDPELWSRNIARHMALSDGSVPGGARAYVIWPENGAPYMSEVKSALQALSRTLPNSAVLIAGGVRREADATGRERYFNSIAVIPETPAGRRAVAFYDKHHLVPFGEYLPFRNVLRAAGLAQLAPYEDGFSPGEGPRTLTVGGPSFAPLVCYEAIFPGALYPPGRRPDWLLTVTNDAWFGDSAGPRQHLDQARLRTIETGLPMARAANTGVSAVIDAQGRYIETLPLYEAGRINAFLPKPLPPTLYARLGDWTYLLLIALAAGVLIVTQHGSNRAHVRVAA
ncbi:MAG: apolipoprotein N-acyltransferase [Parvularculaceae bacterium]